MTYYLDAGSGVFTMVLRESLVGNAADVQKAEIGELLASPMLKAVAWSVLNLDLAGVHAIDAAGIRMLETLAHEISQQRARVRVSNVSDNILKALLEAGLDRGIDIKKTGTAG